MGIDTLSYICFFIFLELRFLSLTVVRKYFRREDMNMKLGSLFSGGGLGDFGFMAAGMEIAWQCEIDEYCQKILALRYPESMKYRDIKTLAGGQIEKVDIITGGFPCQPFSAAGKRGGKEDNRYLWPEMFRVIKECQPRWIVGENVTGIINMELDTVCSDLETEGYEVWPVIFPSHALGAWHRRERVWIIAKSSSKRCDDGVDHRQERQVLYNEDRDAKEGKSERSRRERLACEVSSNVADSNKFHEQRSIEEGNSKGRKKQIERSTGLCSADTWRAYWEIEPSVGRVANGIADRVHRLKMLGNGQVPACTYVIGKMIMDIENN